MSDRNHVPSTFYELLPSGRRYRCLKIKPTRIEIIHSILNLAFKFHLMIIIHVIWTTAWLTQL